MLIIASEFSLHNYIEWQMIVIVYTFCQPIRACVDNCIRISLFNCTDSKLKKLYIHLVNQFLQGLIIATGFLSHNWQIKVIVNTFCQTFLASVDNCARDSIAQCHRRQMKEVYIYIFFNQFLQGLIIGIELFIAQ